jgi:hypothetical protein
VPTGGTERVAIRRPPTPRNGLTHVVDLQDA